MQLIIKDKSRQLCWGMGALEDLCDELGISLQDLDVAVMSNETAILNKLTYCALRNGAEIKDDSLDFNYKYFLNWLDQQDQNLGNEIMKDFLASKILGRTMQERYEEIIARLTANETQDTPVAKKKSTRSARPLATPTNGG